MSKTKDLSSTFNRIPVASQELSIPLGTVQMGQRMGGVAMYSNALKRGYGNSTFGVGDKGLWLGSPDYDTAPYKISLAGEVTITNEDESFFQNQDVLIFYNSTVPEIVIGDPTAAP